MGGVVGMNDFPTLQTRPHGLPKVLWDEHNRYQPATFLSRSPKGTHLFTTIAAITAIIAKVATHSPVVSGPLSSGTGSPNRGFIPMVCSFIENITRKISFVKYKKMMGGVCPRRVSRPRPCVAS